MINIQELNSRTRIADYNCGGFALGIPDWYCPKDYDEGQEAEDMLEDCVMNIQQDCPELALIDHYSDVPNALDVIGFRLAVRKGSVHDFHFILRSEGKWYHKPGVRPIGRVDFAIEKPWPHDPNYNSEIVWFARKHREVSVNDFQEMKPREEE